MDPRTGRRFSYHYQAEPEFFSPQATRVSGVRGRRRSRGPALSEVGPRSHIPNDAGMASLGSHRSTGGGYGYADEEEDFGYEVNPHRHNSRRGGQHDLRREHDRFGQHRVRRGQHDDIVDRHQAGFAEDHPYLAAGARPGRDHLTSQHRGENSFVRESHQDLGMYGASGQRVGRGLRDQCEEAFGDPDAGLSRAMARDCSLQAGSDPREQEGRFVPYTFRMLHRKHVEFLARIFNVRTSTVKEWCEQDFIRMDRMRDCETNIDPLLSTLTSRDRERYARALQRIENEKPFGEPSGWGPRHVPSAYERGFDYGQASVRREQRAEGHW